MKLSPSTTHTLTITMPIFEEAFFYTELYSNYINKNKKDVFCNTSCNNKFVVYSE